MSAEEQTPIVSTEGEKPKKVKLEGGFYKRSLKPSWKEATIILGEKTLAVVLKSEQEKGKTSKPYDMAWYSDFKAIKLVMCGGSRSHMFEVDLSGGAVLQFSAPSH